MAAVITGVGWLTASGPGRGRDDNCFSIPPGRLPEITRESAFDEPYKHFGRMDPFSRLGLSALSLALKDAGLDEWSEKRPMGVIAASAHGCLHTDEAYFATIPGPAGGAASPALFSYTLPNCFLGEAAIRFGLTGNSFVANTPNPAGSITPRMALGSLARGEAKQVLCGCCDLEKPSFLTGDDASFPGAVFFLMESFPRTNAPKPFGTLERANDGGVLFEGSPVSDLPDLARRCLKKP